MKSRLLMHEAVIIGSNGKQKLRSEGPIQTLKVNGVLIHVGLVEVAPLKFDRDAEKNKFKVLVKKRAFSANYRDRGILLDIDSVFKQNAGPEKAMCVGFGSDFVGEVVARGSEARDVDIGDRVINDVSYPIDGYPDTLEYEGVSRGVPSSFASERYEIFHQKKIIRIPREMPDEVAASFSIGAATSYSLIRKLDLKPNERVLVTAAKSNTSLFVINALRKKGVEVYGLSTSKKHERELKELGLKRIIVADPREGMSLKHSCTRRVRASIPDFHGFNVVVDPFFDLYLDCALELMADGGRYITCGRYAQSSLFRGKKIAKNRLDVPALMHEAITKNLHVIGNNAGESSDLERAIEDYRRGELDVVVDSVYSGPRVGEFLDRTYNASDRLGKVVYKYEQ